MATDTTTTATTTMKQGIGFHPETLTPVHWLTGAISLVTGTVHVWLYTQSEYLPFAFAALVFYLAFVGLVLNVYRPVLYALGIPFTAGQIVMWFVTGMEYFEVGVVDKVLQVVLIGLLAYLLYTEWYTQR